ncbi:DNA topoisomerase IB [Lysobacter sp. TY2-98]|uniref:DNA topoisomerase IB n=1 Tax=Lysobacter sp. TY2-98 TaxID=2290922 RepID=UPI000E209EB1|nr:DNA topoisomerase IB [Lysobacter sp. TY2-98]AXK73285.1 DNA topoisomerase IB [Lysobacter sp. TY2-98]
MSVPAPTPESARAAREAGLVYVSDAEPGIRRRKKGDGFSYVDIDGKTISDEATLARIRALAIPPAYTDVWICTDPDGHLQATGRDAKGRKQYRYHADWAAVRGDGKFERIIAFGEALPKLRRRLSKDLKLPGFPRDKVLAIVVSVMARTLIRVGNDSYARSNRSFGLTTLRNRHVGFLRGGRAKFAFRGKSGLEHEIVLDDANLVKLVKHCQQLPGQSLFQYLDDDGATQPVGSAQVNDYLRDALGEAFTAKDFRTWGGTLAAIEKFEAIDVPEDASERALASIEKQVLTEVADVLGNTPAVCRKAYVDPAVFEGWRSGRLRQFTEGARSGRSWELAALRFLRDARRRAAAESRAAKKALRTTRRRTRAGAEQAPRRATRTRARSPQAPVTQQGAAPPV